MKTNKVNPDERIALNLPIVLEGFKSKDAADRAAASWADEVFTAEVKSAVKPQGRGAIGTADAGRGRRVGIWRAVKETWSVIINLRKRPGGTNADN